MRRKVIQIANSTLLVSLPKKWADECHVKKGDEVEIEISGTNITVHTDSKPSVEHAEMHLDDFGVMGPRAIFALYKKGVDEIKIRFDKPEDFQIVQQSLKNETMGYEVIEQGSDFCVIRNVSGQTEEFDSILRRTFLLLITMSSEGLAALRKKDMVSLKNVEHLEQSNNRLTTICRRYLNKMGKSHYSKIGPLYAIIEELEKIADEYKYMFQFLGSQQKVELSKEFFDIYSATHGMFHSFYELFYKFNAERLADLGAQRRSLVGRCINIMQKSKSREEVMATHHLFIIMERIFDTTGPYMILVI